MSDDRPAFTPAAVDERPAFSPPASTRSVRALVLNLILPGVGSLSAGRPVEGALQVALFLVGIPLLFVFGLGALCMLAAYVWGVVLGVRLMADSTRA